MTAGEPNWWERWDPVERRARLAAAWDRLGDDYGSVLSFQHDIAQRLVERARVGPADRVLDLGTGNGLSAVAAARVASDGEVVGVDISPGMLEAAARRVEREGLRNVVLCEMDASSLEFADEEFDCVLASSVFQFVAYTPRVLDEWVRVAKPGGTVALSVGLPTGSMELLLDLMSTYYGRLPEEIRKVMPRAGNDVVPDLAVLAEGAGLSAVVVEDEEFRYELPDFETWWRFQWTHGSRHFLNRLPADALEEMRRDAEERLRGATPGCVILSASMRFCVGQK